MNCASGLSWLGFWIFLSVYFVCECWLYLRGHNTLLLEHKTEEEKELRKLTIAKLRREAGHGEGHERT